MSTISGLNPAHRAHARDLIVLAAHTMVKNKRNVHYSQGADRWEGIARKLSITKGQFPTHCDCSSTAQWMLWDAMARPYGVRDLVSLSRWTAGYTGSQYKNGKLVIHDENLKIGDLLFYGDQGGGVPKHVTVSLGGRLCFSHGGEAGPYILDIDYRSDRRMTRRYI